MSLTPHQQKVLDGCRDNLVKVHSMTGGDVVPITMLFSACAGQPLEVPQVCAILGVTPEPGCKCTEKQLLDGFAQGIEETDDAERIGLIVAQRVTQLVVMGALKGKLVALHDKEPKGGFDKIAAFMRDLAGGEVGEDMLRSLFNCPPGQEVDIRVWMGGFAEALDPTDTVEKIEPVLDKHLAL
eukprot:CAMPEP_0114547524 /NCGR_PEP_ID=MMETSP0114-20121206/4508_1 /TAXON_ID=31324 /ORGANISM="Goniomonas sp, Strain m" /LENGTH=182 /DNA_ID=CAMNT_0001732081 /DNA_START=40 /DNA_END=588 /DNA_ORIENTATION=+